MQYHVTPVYSDQPLSITDFVEGKSFRQVMIGTKTFLAQNHAPDEKELAFATELAKIRNAYANDVQAHPEKYTWHSFTIPKKTGGRRLICAPNPALKEIQRKYLKIFNEYYPELYHTSAFAYIKRRNTLKCLKRHVGNDSRFYMKTDFKDFFNSFTVEKMIVLLRQVQPFSNYGSYGSFDPCYVFHSDNLRWMLNICTMDGRLVQGSPMSPMLTNIMMIPFDKSVANKLRKMYIVYTRYCDDIIMSSKYRIDKQAILKIIRQELGSMYPLTLKDEKTRVGSSKGRNWNLGLMINGDNHLTVGHRQKKVLKARLHHAIMQLKSGQQIQPQEKNNLFGVLNYYRSVEKDYFDYLLRWFDRKYDIDIYEKLK